MVTAGMNPSKRYSELRTKWEWKQIRNCPGRFVLVSPARDLAPVKLAGGEARAVEFNVGAARDPVVVVRLDEGGLISYRRPDGTYVHTLNTEEGFSRKLQQLGIPDPS
jgi:hypothetical protein